MTSGYFRDGHDDETGLLAAIDQIRYGDPDYIPEAWQDQRGVDSAVAESERIPNEVRPHFAVVKLRHRPQKKG